MPDIKYNMPEMKEVNMIFQGPGGIGKTTLAKIISEKREYDSETEKTIGVEQKILRANIKENVFRIPKKDEEVQYVHIFVHAEDKGGQIPFWKQYSEEFRNENSVKSSKPNLVCLCYDMSEFVSSNGKLSNTSLKKLIYGDESEGCVPWILLADKDSKVKINNDIKKMPVVIVGLRVDLINGKVFKKMRKFSKKEKLENEVLKEEYPLAFYEGQGIEAMMTLLLYKTYNEAQINDESIYQILKSRIEVRGAENDTLTKKPLAKRISVNVSEIPEQNAENLKTLRRVIKRVSAPIEEKSENNSYSCTFDVAQGQIDKTVDNLNQVLTEKIGGTSSVELNDVNDGVSCLNVSARAIKNWENENSYIINFAVNVEKTMENKISELETMVDNKITPNAKGIFAGQEAMKTINELKDLKEQALALQMYFAQRTDAVILARTAKYGLGLNIIGIAETSSYKEKKEDVALTHEIEQIIVNEIKKGNVLRR